MDSSNNKMKLLLLILLFSVTSVSSLFAQIKTLKNLSVEDGLVYSQVLCAYQDKKGYMWFGTSSGLSCWDGQNFKNYHTTEKTHFDNIKLITELKNGSLAFVKRNGILTYQNNLFAEVPDLPSNLASWIHQAIKGENGQLYLLGDSSGIWQFDGIDFIELTAEADLTDFTVQSLGQINKETLILGTKEHGLLSLKTNQTGYSLLPGWNVPQNISWISERNGEMFVGTKGFGLFLFKRQEFMQLNSMHGIPGDHINHIYIDSKGNSYIATDKGIAVISEGKVTSVITTENGLSKSYVWWIGEDRQGNIYFCTDGGGVDIYRPGVYQTYNKDSGLPDNTVWSIIETSDHRYYFATDQGVAVVDSGKMHIISTKQGLSDNMVIIVFEAKDGSILYGTNGHGVDISRNGRFRNLRKENGLTSNSVWTIVEDKQGRIYLGTYDGGICVYVDGQIVDTLDAQDGLANNYIVSAYASPSGIIYFGLDNGGVYKVINGILNIDEVLLPGLTVWSIYQNSTGDLFFGTDKNGLIIISPSKIDTLSVADGLSNNSILGIMEDDFGKLYLTTDNGLNIIDFENNNPRIRILTSEDGLASNECNQGAYLQDSNCCLWIGTIKGVTRYDPSVDVYSNFPPRIHITSMKVFEEEVALNSAMTAKPLKYDQNYIRFNFIGIDLSAPHKVRYRYKLNNTDSEWMYTQHPQINYANLENNDYLFEVQACNEWGVWSESASVSFIILAPFWETWWFRSLVLVFFMGIIAMLIYWRIHQLLAVERVRAKIAADLHDDIGAGLSEINILSAVAEAKTPKIAKEYSQNELSKIAKIARKMIDDMSDIVWMIKPQKDTMTDLVSRLKDSFNDVLDAKGISFRFENSHLFKNIKLNMEQRQFIFLIFKEAINNAIKYSDCSEIKLKISTERKKIIIILQDNGKGFDIKNTRQGNGLINMYQRAKEIKAELAIDSRINEGTTIKFGAKI